jgi:hypothetical protein
MKHVLPTSFGATPMTYASSSLHDLTYIELQRRIDAVAEGSVSTPIGLRDAFTDNEVLSLLDHPCRDVFPNYFVDWVWNTADAIDLESGVA